MKRSILIFNALLLLILLSSTVAIAQVKIGDLPINIDELFGKVKILKVKKGFSPVFSLGDVQLNKVGIFGEKLKGIKLLGEVFDKKNIAQVTQLYKTYKTGLVVFKILAASGTGVAAYSAIRGIAADNNFDGADVRRLLYPALGSIAVGITTKILTKKASYKAVDVFNGIARKKIKEIFSIQPASSTLGAGIYVKL